MCNCLGLEGQHQDSNDEAKAKTLTLKTKTRALGRKNEIKTKTSRKLVRDITLL